MNILKHAAKACRSVSRSLLFPASAIARIKPVMVVALERALETVARVMCVESHGVMVCGQSGASVAHLSGQDLSGPAHSSQPNAL